MLEFFGVGKRIVLYLARISPQQTIDHLVFEVGCGARDGAHGQRRSRPLVLRSSRLRFTAIQSSVVLANGSRRAPCSGLPTAAAIGPLGAKNRP